IKVAIKHKTVYQFDRLVEILPHTVRLRPAPHSRTPIKSYSLMIEPKEHFINWQQDPFSNYLARVVFPEPANKLSLDVEVIADLTVINPFDFFLEESAEHIPFKYDKQLLKDLAPYLAVKERGKHLQAWVDKIDRSKTPTVQFLVGLNQALQQEIGYLIRMEPGVQTCEQTLSSKSGSCRDSGWLLVQIMRHLGLAARFVSGYLVQLKSDVKSLDGPSGPEQDFTDLHAWAEVYIPGAGWVGLDPTSGLFAAEGHIPLACTPDPVSAAAVTGSTGNCKVEFSFENKDTRIHEDPRVTKPYTDGQWRKIDELGKQVDGRLSRQRVKLTMGGEPTFVSIDDMESAQWNTAALGADKRKLAGSLLLALKQQFGKKGALQFGQGKWYPGEPIPRWALGLFWRNDGKPLWHNTRWLNDESKSGRVKPDQSAAFIKALAGRLRVNKRHIIAAFEDTWHYINAESKLPANLTVDDNKLNNPLDRERLRKVLTGKLGETVGYVLPLAWLENPGSKGWHSCRWYLRREKLFLVPGDSSMGYRLPLESIPWQKPADAHVDFDADPFAEEEDLTAGKAKARKIRESETIFQTALCCQVREGRLYLILPPVSRLAHYIELLQEIEETAAELRIPVVLEGYHPPRDRRLSRLLITPDPGVIEVNVHPASNWEQLLEIISNLYDIAREQRLGTEKFMLDGKHSGTGGGNHVTLGAHRAEDSPFLRRPHLLGSMIRYWQNHPCLSYLFSGQFIGPTSQSPRVDEARDDNLYELEIALQQLGEGDSFQPWMVDRLLRNFLVDLTGNTHRAEFCIDKLYSPDSATGRLGLVEFRNFEMPPH
ncbi:MAG: transglutaminase family protein, partial [Gammaproteobacteria bacterium]